MDWLRSPTGRRVAGIGVAVLLECVLLLLLASLGIVRPPGQKSPDVVSFTASSNSEDAPDSAESSKAESQANQRQAPHPQQPSPSQPPQLVVPQPPPPAAAVIPTPQVQPSSAPVYPRPIQPIPPGSQAYGPADTGSRGSGDSSVVGTAPNGEPLYAARWYREPYDDELRGYLSTATGPGWGLIACKTAPDFRVEDCVPLQESPLGSQINRAILAAAWQFKVRPPQLGGRPLVGAWVRIRIDYTMRPASRASER